jgi:glycine/D-amino acid oxidase-like deaminating enzyme
MATVIIGAGIVGCSTAFYLTRSPSATDPSTVHLVESSPELFASASGYGAGFLARDWFSDSVAPLGTLSFDLHKELAAKHNGAEKWGYSRSTGTSLVQVKGKRGDEWLREGTSRAATAGSHEFSQGHGPAWLTRSKIGKVEVISQDDSTAQVFVSLFIRAMPL